MFILPTLKGLAGNNLSVKTFKNAALDLNFASGKSLVDSVSGNNLITFARASSGTFVGADGLIKTAVTNLSLRSQELGDAAWTKTLSSITADATIAPNGTTTADKLVENSSTGAHIIAEATAITYTSGLAYTFSFFIKKAERQTVQILMHPNPFPGTVAQRTAIFNSNTGGFVSVGSAYTGSSVTVFSDGWYRVSVSSTSDATTTGNFTITLCSDDIGTTSYTGDGTSGLFLWGAQLEQASTAGEYIPTTSVINSAPRFDHNPTTGESLGLLVEEARTNLILQSEAIDNAIWNKIGGGTGTTPVVNANSVVAPDGTTTADQIILSLNGGTTVNDSSYVTQSYTSVSSTTYTISMWLRTASGNVTISLDVDSQNTNTVTVTPAWQRFSFARSSSTSGSRTVRFGLRGTFSTSDSATFYAWGAQLEAGAFATSYIRTTTATVTRAADVASITGTNFSSWYNQTEGTVFGQFLRTASTNTQQGRVFSFSDGTNTNLLEIYQTAGSNPSAQITATTVQANWTPSGFTVGTSIKEVLGYQLNNSNASFNGSAETLDTVCNIPTLTQARIGDRQDGVRNLNGTIQRLTYWPVRLGNNVLQQITQ